jgi:cysteine-rich repeat protein
VPSVFVVVLRFSQLSGYTYAMVRANRWVVLAWFAVSGWGACGRTNVSHGVTDRLDAAPLAKTEDAAAPARDIRLATDQLPPVAGDVALAADGLLAVDVPVAGGDGWLAPDAAPPRDFAIEARGDLAIEARADLGIDTRSSLCGNGMLDLGEQCDDGNTWPGDGCDSNCKIECDFGCWPNPRPPMGFCGDGRLSGGEDCDDGNTLSGDGCSSVCDVERGYHCPAPGLRCTPTCGDSLLTPPETCDDGNTRSGDGCSEFCLIEPERACDGGICSLPGSIDGGQGASGFCGDGVIQGAEECDDGADNSDAHYGGCSAHCRYIICGDGIVSNGEECDLGSKRNTALYGDGCTVNCKLPHYCGDGIVDSEYGEQCDLGKSNNTGGSGCMPTCVVYLP